MSNEEQSKPPFPPFTAETAAQKACMAEDAWNSRDPERVVLAYTPDSGRRNRVEFIRRKFRWPAGPRPEDHPGLSELGL